MDCTEEISYQKAEEYLLGIPKFTKKNTVEETRAFYQYLGSPGSNSKIIHIAGTNGKGSVCAYLSSIALEAGYTAAMFTSPHLVTMRERFRVNGQMISEPEFVRFFVEVHRRLEKLWEQEGQEEASRYHPTFFEYLFFMAMLFFEREKTEMILLETGLGGRLDATNVVEHPAVTVLTEIGMDHMEYLGGTLEEIAAEKAGILKAGCPVVFSDKLQIVSRIIKNRAKSLGNKVFPVSPRDYEHIFLRNKTIDFSLHCRYYDYISLTLSTTAPYQVENAALAVQTAELLDGPEHRITGLSILEGLKKARWEGRMEEVLPGVYVDGAHNEDGVRAFLDCVRADGCGGERYLLFSTVGDKRYESMIHMLLDGQLFTHVAAAPLENERAVPLHRLKEAFAGFPGYDVSFHEDAGEAFEHLVARKKDGDRVYAAGSLYLVGELKRKIQLCACGGVSADVERHGYCND